MRILIVDDSRAMRMIVRRTLRQAGMGSHEVVEAENGREALQQIKAGRPDLILCDWNMPVMSGIELLELLKQHKVNIPFGFVTSQNTAAMKERARQAGALFVISKPFKPETFEQVLSHIAA